jgi:hypothetical protein
VIVRNSLILGQEFHTSPSKFCRHTPNAGFSMQRSNVYADVKDQILKGFSNTLKSCKPTPRSFFKPSFPPAGALDYEMGTPSGGACECRCKGKDFHEEGQTPEGVIRIEGKLLHPYPRWVCESLESARSA